jgi:hypothetical protein
MLCCLELLLREGSYENPRKIQDGGICFRGLTVSRAQGEPSYNFFLREKNDPKYSIKRRISII